MKKIVSIFLISLLALCAAFAQETTTAVALQKDTALWNEKEPGMMEWAKKDLDPGTVLEVYLGRDTDSQGRKKPDIVVSSWTNAKKGQTMNFARVNYQGKDYYVIANRIAAYQKPAVVIRSAATYLTKNLADVRKTALPHGTVIAVGEEVSVQGLKLYELTFYDENQYRVRIGYIKKEKVSTSKDDITAMKLLKQAENITDENRRFAMLDSISQLSISPSVQELLDKALEEFEEPEESEDDESEMQDMDDMGEESASDKLETVKLDENGESRMIYTSDDSSVNLRAAPVNGNVLKQLPNQSGVMAYERTAATYSMDGNDDYWYYVDDGTGTKGWVFGAYCVPKE